MKKSIVAFVQCSSEYSSDVPFDPPKGFSELPLVEDGNNTLYSAVRDVLYMLGLDRDRFNTPEWNPLGELVSQGQKVLIKPNFVKHIHYTLGENAVISTVTHGSVIRPLVDYAYKAVGPTGRIIIADTPIEQADFSEILRLTGVGEMTKVLQERGVPINVMDLRCQRLTINEYLEPVIEKLTGDPGGYLTINLGSDSEFSELDCEEQNYHTLGDHLVDFYDPFTREIGQPNVYHYPSVHKYIVSHTVLDSDLVISVPKLKTHKKAGVTLSLKNILGMVPSKESMPHYRPGMPPCADACPVPPSSNFIKKRNFLHFIKRNPILNRIIWKCLWEPLPRHIKDTLLDAFLNKGKPPIEWGDWYGNDTIWRTIVDLNKILFYADENGTMHKNQQRRYLSIIDGIIGQEGEGPTEGSPIRTGLLIGGLNPIAVDVIATEMMGFDYTKIKTIIGAAMSKTYSIGSINSDRIIVRTFKGSGYPNLRFRPPRGWIRHVEKDSDKLSFHLGQKG